jgi:hypothetical protein
MGEKVSRRKMFAGIAALGLTGAGAFKSVGEHRAKLEREALRKKIIESAIISIVHDVSNLENLVQGDLSPDEEIGMVAVYNNFISKYNLVYSAPDLDNKSRKMIEDLNARIVDIEKVVEVINKRLSEQDLGSPGIENKL